MKKWTVINNSQQDFREDSFEGKCNKFNENATLYIHLSDIQGSKSDLQLTFTPRIKECNLLKEKNDKDTTCMLWCPVFKAYKDSHSY